MTTTNRLAGTIFIKRDGVLLDVEGEFTIGMGNPERTSLKSSDGRVIGYSEETSVPFIEGSLFNTGDLDLSELLEADDETITLEMANGKTVALSNAWQTKHGEVSTGNSTVPVRWEGKSIVEYT